MKRTALAVMISLTLLSGCGTSAKRDAVGSPSTSPDLPSAAATGLPRQVQAVIHTDHAPAGLVVGRKSLFVSNHRGGTVQRINPTTNKVIATVTVGGQVGLESSTTIGGTAAVDERTTWLWACTNIDGNLHQINPRTMRVTATVAASCDGGWRTRIGRNLWAVPGENMAYVLLIDLVTGSVTHREYLPSIYGWGSAISAGGHVLIGSFLQTPVMTRGGKLLNKSVVATPSLRATGGRLYRIGSDGTLDELDPATLDVRRSFKVAPYLDGDPSLVADDSGHLYYRPDATHVYDVDTADGKVTLLLTLPWAEVSTTMAWAFGSLWITNFDDDTIWRVDPRA